MQTMTRPELSWPLELEPAEVRARFRWAKRSGHPRYVWPELAVAAWRRALEELERVVATVLAGRTVTLTAESSTVRALGIAAFTSGVGPLIGRWIENGRVETEAGVAEVFGLHLLHGRARAERQAAQLERVAASLVAEGIEPLVVKSAHIAREYYPEPGVRPAVDVDVVVAPGELGRAERALASAGYRQSGSQHRPRKSDWLPPGVEPYPRSLELLHSGSHYGVDLQTSLDRNFFGVRTVRLAGAASAPGRPAGLPAGTRVLAHPQLVIYHALHASEGLHSTTLIRLVDLVLIARRDAGRGTLDWDAVSNVLERSGGARFAYPSLALAERLAPGTVPAPVLERLERAAPRRMLAIVRSVSPATADRPEALSVRERFMWCTTPWEHVRRVVHMVAPASAGRSVRRLAERYAERAYRVVRGRIRVNGASG